jgi:uncharacterized membrane protein YfcA
MSAWEGVAVEYAMLFVAGALRGFTGFGFSLAAVPLLSLIMPPAHAIPIVLILQLLVSIAGLRDAVRHCDWRSIRMLTVGAAVATPLGVLGLAHQAAAPVRLAIAVVVVCGALVLGRGFRLAIVPVGWRVLPFGMASGLFNGLAGIPGPRVIAFYLASPVSSAVARSSMIVFFLLTAVLALVPLAWFGLLPWAIVVEAAIGFPVVLVGSWLGAYAYGYSADRHYRFVALAFLLVTAALSAWRAASDYAV